MQNGGSRAFSPSEILESHGESRSLTRSWTEISPRIKDESSGMIWNLWTRDFRWGFSFVTWDYEIAPWNGNSMQFFWILPPYPGWNRGKLRFLEILGCMLHVTHVFRPGNNRKIPASWVGVFYEAKKFPLCHCYKLGENPKYHRLCTQNNLSNDPQQLWVTCLV